MKPGSELNACDCYQMIPLISCGLMPYDLIALIATPPVSILSWPTWTVEENR
tara:strand:+ start:1462 stop:1617 length:156 start_codon:yes stop_codon:yes gene_type:complete